MLVAQHHLLVPQLQLSPRQKQHWAAGRSSCRLLHTLPKHAHDQAALQLLQQSLQMPVAAHIG